MNTIINTRIQTNIGLLNIRSFPKRDRVHLYTLIPVGTAIIIVAELKYSWVSVSIPATYKWWAHTKVPTLAILNIANSIVLYPIARVFLVTHIQECVTEAKAGRIITYTSGWAKNQNMFS